MPNEETLKVRIQHGETSVEFEGSHENVWRSINKYLSEIYPSLSAVKKLVGAIDVSSLAELVSGKAQIVNGRIAVSAQVDAKKRILFCLAAAYVGKALGLLERDDLTPKEISLAAGLAERITRARLSEMRKQGLVIKAEEGRYVFSPSAANMLATEEAKQ